MSQNEAAGGADQEAVRRLEQDASSLMSDLASLSARIKQAASGRPDAAGGDQKTAEELTAQLKVIQERIARLGTDSRKTLAQLDQNIRENPYPFIIGALGLGVLLGKVMRS